MNRYKKLLGNSFIFAIGNLGSKLLQFLMIPLYSYTLTTTEFGKVDLIITTVSLIVPIISLEIGDGIFRFVLDKKGNDKHILQQSLNVLFFPLLIFFIICIIIDQYISGYSILLLGIQTIVTVYFTAIQNYVRAIGSIKQFAFSGILNTFVLVILNMLTLVYLKLGVNGYLLSMIFGLLISLIYLCVVENLWFAFKISKIDKKLMGKIIMYSIPLIPNMFAWWLNSASDKYYILFFLGTASNGIYSMANKVPSVVVTLTNIFSQSWQISAVEEHSSKDSKKFNGEIFLYYIIILIMASIGIMSILRYIFKYGLSHAYYDAWKVVPLLLLSVIYSSLSGFLGTLYTTTKNTVPIMTTTIIGAVINVILSLILVPTLKLQGAALANVISFLSVLIMRYVDLKRDDYIEFNSNNLINYSLIFIIYSLALFLIRENYIVLLLGILCEVLVLFKNRKLIVRK